jgi:hypothetical protein
MTFAGMAHRECGNRYYMTNLQLRPLCGGRLLLVLGHEARPFFSANSVPLR